MNTENDFKKTSNTFFDKKDFLKMGAVFVATSVAAYLLFSCPTPPPPPPNSNNTLISTNQMRDYYNQYTDADRIPILYNAGGVLQLGKLEGFPIATADLENIIHYNVYSDPSNPNGPRIIPDKILFYLGQDGTSNDNTGQKYNNIKMIAVGVTGTTLMVPTTLPDINNKLKSSIYDKAMPCPGPGCPTKPPPPQN